MSEPLVAPLGFPATVTVTSLTLPPGWPLSRWGEFMGTLGGLERASRWWLGDALAYGEAHYGEKAAQYLDRTGLAPHTLLNLAWVSRRIPASRRRESLTWSHHEAVAALDPLQQESWLAQAEASEGRGLPWSVQTMRRALRATRSHELDAGRVSLQVVGDRLAEAVLALAAARPDNEIALWNAACGLAAEWQQRRGE